jgi:hypothetical protein
MSTRGHESITATVDPQAVTYTAIEFAEAEAEAVRIKAAEAEQARLDRANLVMALIEEDVEDNDEARAALIQLLDAQGVLRYRETEKVNSWLITDDEVIFMTTTYTGETIRVVVGVNGQVLREAI